jgi:hypothetical protein
VKGSVEDGDVEDVRTQTPRILDRRERWAILERRQLGHRRQLVRDRVIDQRRLAKLRAAVRHAVRDRRDLSRRRFERVERLGGAVGGDERELQARRARVDDQDRKAQYGQTQSRISGASSPCSRV